MSVLVYSELFIVVVLGVLNEASEGGFLLGLVQIHGSYRGIGLSKLFHA